MQQVDDLGESLDSPADTHSDEEVSSATRPQKKPKPATAVSASQLIKKLPLQSVVKLFVTKVGARFDAPWKKANQRSSSGSGFVIGERLILTNAHCLHQHTNVRVRRPGIATKFAGKVLCIGRQVDLAVLTVEDDLFWADLPPVLSLADELPSLDSDVTAVGYPTGGDGISVTRGVVSRICIPSYVTSGEPLLTIQIDAAINPGNSGGPVFGPHKTVIGVARAHFRQAQNIGYIISAKVVRLFLASFRATGLFGGVSSLGIRLQNLESASLRRRLHVDDGMFAGTGVRVREVAPLGPLSGLVQSDDVLLAVSGQLIASDSTVALAPDRLDERLHFFHLISERPVGDSISLDILRAGEKRTVSCELTPHRHLVPILHNVDCVPRYLIVGGLVFVPLTFPWIHESFGKNPVSHAVAQAMLSFPENTTHEIVVLAKVLAADTNFGFQRLKRIVLSNFNGQDVVSLAHLSKMIAQAHEAKADFLDFEFHDNQRICLDRGECEADEAGILAQHSIPAAAMDVEMLRPQ